MPAGKIKLKFEPLPHNLFRMEVEKSNVQNDLAASDYVEFSPDLEFAGLSKRGKLLSVPKSKGPARIGGYPLRVEATGAGWIEINDRKTLLLTTDKPDIIVVCNPNCHWSGPRINIAVKHIPERFEPVPDSTKLNEIPGKDVVSGELTEVLHLYTTYPAFRIYSDRFGYHIGMPQGTRLSAQEWKSLKRHIYTGQESASLGETVEETQRGSCIWFPGGVLAEVMEKFGISGQPAAYYDGQLGFEKLEVTNAAKAAALLPDFQHFQGKTLHATYGGFSNMRVPLPDLLRNPELFEQMSACYVEPGLKTVTLGEAKFVLPHLKHPVRRCEWNGKMDGRALCPAHLIEKFFVPLAKASRTHKTEGIQSYQIQTREEFHSYAPGRWVLIEDLAGAEKRDHSEEAKERKERKAGLEQQYGKMPRGWEKLTDEQVGQYFAIQKKLAAGQLVDVKNSKILPDDFNHKEALKSWLISRNRIVTCPLTNEAYIVNINTIEELAALPEFYEMLQQLLREKEWLAAIVLSPAIQTAALAESI